MRLPSLNALRAFEAVARLGSLTRAAAELHVTPSAVRHQIRALEEDLGRTLLRRSGNALVPTEAANGALGHLRRAFDALADANRSLRSPARAPVLRVSAVPSFISAWLIPRLDAFHARHPEVTVQVDTNPQLTDFAREGVDLAVRYGLGGYPGLFECRLFSERYFPVCAPRLLDGPEPLAEPADLARHTLLHDAVRPRVGWPVWRDWLDAAGVLERVDPDSGTHYTMSMFAYQAAVAGQGVALGTTVLAMDLLAAGYLVKPFELELPTAYGYHIVCPPERRERGHVAAFIDWLLEAAGAACTGMEE
ncbi:LysR family transcriptional regulator [Thalassobaculum fulvum]|uniref:LysR family transcriptional regulator n=1 Tax=Thalassobaculum fulvum TaxID=1633335 RepID=A0A919CSF9_9PROT|nr:transcriptional regulator GcvA [Thalassobaculum fulvum]GHD63268.1 LysR family transcriptional regulator [Thalassobaculum fulvum]